MLADGPYPWPLKQRVAGNHGHLSNAQAASLLASIELGCLQRLVLSHISEKNNHPDLAVTQLQPVLEGWSGEMLISSQQAGFDWLVID